MVELYKIQKHNSPIISLALHDGHFIPDNMREYLALDEHERFREEDPYTSILADLPTSQAVVHSSRFMVDLNRSMDKCLYQTPEDAWGLTVWKSALPEPLRLTVHQVYQQFYKDMKNLIEQTIAEFGCFFILDIHSYNHRRVHSNRAADTETNPEINLGTAYNAEKWHPIIDKFKRYLSGCMVNEKFLDVRENVKFKGGGFAQWLTSTYGEEGGIISIEFKKTFMDEWTGRGDIPHILDLHAALKGSLPLLRSELLKSALENKIL